QVVKMLLKLLEDKNGEVQNLAVKCLGPLVNKVKEYQVETIVDSLCNNMVSDKEQLRDISSIGLKTVIGELPACSGSSLVASICKKMTGRLSRAIGCQEDVAVQLEALDILGDLLCRFGATLVPFQPAIMEALLPQLQSPRLAVRKRSITAIGFLVLSCSQGLFNKLMDALLEELSKNSCTSTTRTYIQCIGTISALHVHELAEHCDSVNQFLHKRNLNKTSIKSSTKQICKSLARRVVEDVDMDNELGRCRLSMYDTTLLNSRLSLGSLRVVRGEGGTEGEEEEEEEEGVGGGRQKQLHRTAKECTETLVCIRFGLVASQAKSAQDLLVVRKQCQVLVGASTRVTSHHDLAWFASQADCLQQQMLSNVTAWYISVGPLVRALGRPLREKGLKTRQGCLCLLTELLLVLPGALANHLPQLLPGLQFSLVGDKNSSSNMKIDTLAFLHCLLTYHSPSVFHPHINTLVPPIIHAVGDSFYKITSEALLVLQQLVKVLRPLEGTEPAFAFEPYVADIYQCTLAKLKAADIDQEVKERAITCMGQILCHLGDRLQPELAVCLPIFLDRLRNEITRLTTVKALTRVAGSRLHIELSPMLPDCVPVLSSFLRKNQRALKLATLTLLDTLVRNYSSSLSPEMVSTVMRELPPLISEADLHISQVSSLLTSMSRVHQQSLSLVSSAILPEILVLVRSPLLQVHRSRAVTDPFRKSFCSVCCGSFEDFALAVVGKAQYSRPSSFRSSQTFSFQTKCRALSIRQVIEVWEASRCFYSWHLRNLLAMIEKSPSFPAHRDLSGIVELQTVLLEAFSSQSEEVKTAASFALGDVSVGNLPEYLPFLLREIGEQPRRQYLLLHSLKESASPESIQALEPFIESIWALLVQHWECPEEGARNVVAECLGRLSLSRPQELLPRLEACLASPSPLARATVVAAAKWALAERSGPWVAVLGARLSPFLEALGDPDLGVRRVALLALNSAAHNRPLLVRDLLPSLLPRLYQETRVRMELIREVEMGPFKHTVDDGLDIRKAAFECMYTLLDTCLEQLDVFEFLNHVEEGLRDHYDIKMLTYLMLVRLACLCPAAILQRLERLVEPLKATCGSKIKANSVKQEFEKQDELKRSAMRAFTALLAIPDADKNPLMNEFLSQIKSTPDLQILYEGIQKDTSAGIADTVNTMDVS
ncbi:tip120, putative, partial [Ixodes scapularis]